MICCFESCFIKEGSEVLFASKLLQLFEVKKQVGIVCYNSVLNERLKSEEESIVMWLFESRKSFVPGWPC